MRILHRSIPPLDLITISILLVTILAGTTANASQRYGLTEDAGIELDGHEPAALEGTLRLANRSICLFPLGDRSRCNPSAYGVLELDLIGGGHELRMQPLPAVPLVSISAFPYDHIRVLNGDVSLQKLILEREILYEGERAPGENLVAYREQWLTPTFDSSGSGYGDLVFDNSTDMYPSAMRINFVLQEYVATVIYDANGLDDGFRFTPYFKPGSESVTTLAVVTIHASPIPEPPPPLPVDGAFIGLGPNFGESHATGVSDDGRSVSGSARSSRTMVGFRWTLGSGKRSVLGNLRATRSRAQAISPDGRQLTGILDAPGYSDPNGEAAFWNNKLELERLEGTSVYRFAIGEDVTSGGEVVGWVQMFSPYRIQAQRWDAEGIRTPLPDLNPEERRFGRAHALSRDASVIVGVSRRDNLVPNTAVRWIDSSVEDLGALADDAWSWAWDVSADGNSVVGWSGNASLKREAFRWTPDLGMQGLGDLPGGDFSSEAYAVSAEGWFVVGSSLGENGEEAFIWDPDHGMQSIQRMLEQAFRTQLEGWQLTRGTGITPDGRVIVGDGINPNGFEEAWIAILPVPEPSASASGLFAVATIVGLALGNRRLRNASRCSLLGPR